MITEKQNDKIIKKMSNFFHIHKLNSPVFGEPFLDNGYIYYFDGATLTFMTERVGGKTNAKSIESTLKKITGTHKPNGVIVWGEVPEYPDIKLEGYQTSCVEKKDIFHTEMRVFDDFAFGEKARRALNKMKNLGMTLKIVKSNFYPSEYLDLLAETHENRITDSNNLAYYAVYPLSEKIKFAEIRTKENELAGVIIVYDNSPRYVCLAEIGYSKKIQMAGAITVSAVLNEFAGKTQIISLGGSANENIFNSKKRFFKKLEKWSAYPYYTWAEYVKKGTDWDNLWWIDRMKKKTTKTTD